MYQRSKYRVGLIFISFFVVSLFTNMTGPLIPDMIRGFHLSFTMAALLPFSFFAAYALMSIPAGFLIERFGEKKIMLSAFSLAFAGAFLFCLFPSYLIATTSLFMIGVGMACLQVAINPLLRVSGGEENYAFNAVAAQLFFGAASFLSPLIYTHFSKELSENFAGEKDFLTQTLSRVVPAEFPWLSLHWIFAMISLLMIVIVFLSPFPQLQRSKNEEGTPLQIYLQILKRPVVWAFFFGIFSYVFLEQGLSNWMSQYLSTQHGFNPTEDGAMAVSRFWGLITVGCLFGLALLKFFDSRRVLIGFSTFGFITLSGAIFGPAEMSFWCFSLMGLSMSVMWSIIFSLALNSIERHQGTFSGVLCTGVVGGALGPVVVGSLGDAIGLKWGLCFLYLPLVYLFLVGFWARPLIKNKTF